MTSRQTRREFLRRSGLLSTAAVAGGVWSWPARSAERSANEKLNIGIIGTANQARYSMRNVRGENIVALSDINDNYLAKAVSDFPGAQKYNDFRKLLDQENIDAVVVATPDHIHVPAAVMAMKRGKHVYCEKPLSHSVYESRVAAQTAKEHGVATQLGTQIHAGENYRRVVEIIQSGAIGPVRECHVWVGKGWGGGERPQATPAVPAHLHWDLWLGPAPYRPYHSTYLPANWRRWWDFGGGTLGDMGCHYVDLPFWALKLRHPLTVEAEGPPVHPETAPLGMTVRYEFPARGDLPAVKFTWYDGDHCPRELYGHRQPGSGVWFVGDKGMMFADYGRYRLFPESDFADYQRPEPTIGRSIGHHAEWIQACKTGSPTTCNFDYSGALSEAVLLGNVAYRAGKKLEWDAENLKATNCPEADALVRREYRNGWTL